MAVQWDVSSISRLQEHTEFMHSWKLCLNLCSFRWLKFKRKWVNNFNAGGQKCRKYCSVLED